MIYSTRTRWLGGTAMLAVMVVLLTGCTVSFYSMTYSTSTSGRAPDTFATACDEIRGTLSHAAATDQDGDRSICTMSNNDKITCDWTFGVCTVECFSSDEVCAATVQFMGYMPPALSGTPVAHVPAPHQVVDSEVASNTGASPLHLTGAM